MAPESGDARDAAKHHAAGYHMGDVDTVISVEEVTRQAKEMAVGASLDQVAELARNGPYVVIEPPMMLVKP